MEVIAFVGDSGSGKSYRALWVAKENNIFYVIDDGLLIKGNRVIAGFSAKKEPTRLASIRRALFMDSYHAKEVKHVIAKEKPGAILILGTSLRMVDSITKKLGLPEISRVIYIEDIASKNEIEKARKIREKQGKHVIPVPTFEIKKDFSGYLLNPLRVFRKKDNNGTPFIDDKSVVRPTFSYMGEYTISDSVVKDISKYKIKQFCCVTKINSLWIESNTFGIKINISLTFKYGTILPNIISKIQTQVKKDIENFTSLNVLKVNIIVKTLSFN